MNKHTLILAKLTTLTTLAVALAACSSTPDRNLALDAARSHYLAVQTETAVSQHAVQEIKRAGAALQLAEAAQAAGDGQTAVDHLAYLANQRVTVAQATAASRAAQAAVAGAAAERDRVRLALRTAEADEAQRLLQASEQAGARKNAELAQADRSAQDDRARLADRKAQVDSLQTQLRELNARQTERGIVVTLGDMLFDSGQSRLQLGGTRNVMQLAEFMNRHPQRRASIEGYTDSVGSAASNQSLSDRRAQSVMSALVNLGVGAERLSATGFGQDSPVAGNGSAAGRQMNRRVEVVFAAEAGDILTK